MTHYYQPVGTPVRAEMKLLGPHQVARIRQVQADQADTSNVLGLRLAGDGDRDRPGHMPRLRGQDHRGLALPPLPLGFQWVGELDGHDQLHARDGLRNHCLYCNAERQELARHPHTGHGREVTP